MKFIIEVIEVDGVPADQYKPASWPKPGVYRVKGEEDRLRFVSDFSVDTVWHPSMHLQPFNDPGECVSESLLLKVIAAASQASVLKGAL